MLGIEFLAVSLLIVHNPHGRYMIHNLAILEVEQVVSTVVTTVTENSRSFTELTKLILRGLNW